MKNYSKLKRQPHLMTMLWHQIFAANIYVKLFSGWQRAGKCHQLMCFDFWLCYWLIILMINNDWSTGNRRIIPNNKKAYQAVWFEFPEMLWTWSEHEDRGPGAACWGTTNKTGVGGFDKSNSLQKQTIDMIIPNITL